jgi:hypothetical protein
MKQFTIFESQGGYSEYKGLKKISTCENQNMYVPKYFTAFLFFFLSLFYDMNSLQDCVTNGIKVSLRDLIPLSITERLTLILFHLQRCNYQNVRSQIS